MSDPLSDACSDICSGVNAQWARKQAEKRKPSEEYIISSLSRLLSLIEVTNTKLFNHVSLLLLDPEYPEENKRIIEHLEKERGFKVTTKKVDHSRFQELTVWWG